MVKTPAAEVWRAVGQLVIMMIMIIMLMTMVKLVMLMKFSVITMTLIRIKGERILLVLFSHGSAGSILLAMEVGFILVISYFWIWK